MTFFVLGAGFTGAALARRVAAERPAVRLVTTHTRPTADGGPGEVWAWRAPEPLPEPVCPDDAVVALFPPRGVDPVAAARAVAGGRLVYVSATSVYGNCGGAEVTEDTPPSPAHPAAVARLAAEDAMRAVGATVVRAAGIYGPGRNVVERHRAGQLRNAGDPHRPVNLIHVEDLVTIVLAALERGRPGEVLLAATGQPVRWWDLATVAAERTGLPMPPPTPVPDNPDLASFYTESKRIQPTAYERLGVTLEHADTLATLRTF